MNTDHDVAPVPTGELLCSISRPGYDGAADERLDIRWDRWQDRPFVSLRVWRRMSDGVWVPLARKGLSVRLRELRDVIEGLTLAERRAASEPRPGPSRGGERLPARRPDLPAARSGELFDEFA